MGEQIVIRSYRGVFRLRRRIYRVDRWAIPVPGGLPLAGLGYFAATLAGVCVLGALPLIGGALELLSPPVRFVLIPLAVAVLASQVAPDGRRVDRFLRSWMAFRVRRLRRRLREAGRGDASIELFARGDEHGPRLARARVRGPARVKTNGGAGVSTALSGRPVLRSAVDADPVEIELGNGEVLEVKP